MKHLETVQEKYKQIKNSLNERSRRLWAASEAMVLGYGGVSILMSATGLSRNAINHGILNIKSGKISDEDDRIRCKGGGRKKLEYLDEKLLKELDALVSPETRGDPESPLRWTTKSTRKLSSTLKQKGIPVSHEKIAQLLKSMGYSLQAPRKTNEGKSHPDRNSQFEYINHQAEVFQNKGLPVISIDAKKKELIGEFKNGGREYQPNGCPVKANVYDFQSLAKGKVTPYGIYDIAKNTGWVNIGISKDTAQFAVASLRSWWTEMGIKSYPNSKKLLVNADGGGSNGSRNRLWKIELQKFSTESGLEVTVNHFPPGTSKWNKIEHRLFSQITKNWRGKSLESLEIIVNLIGTTSTKTGLKVYASVDPNEYESGIKISDKELKDINIKKHEFHGNDWNYTIFPRD